MAGSRTLKLSILADVDDLKKKLGQGEQEVSSFGDKLGEFGKKAAAAFAVAAAAAAAYAGKLLIEGVKSAIEDEKAQAKLATTLENVTGATEKQIKAVEDQISKLTKLYGITDDELRPSFERLVRATESVKRAHELQSLAIDIAAGSGKSLAVVTELLAKAYDGNINVLKKLGVETQTVTTSIKDNSAAADRAEKAQLNYTLAVDKYGPSSQQAQKALLAYEQAIDKANDVTTKTSKSTISFDDAVKQLSQTFGGQAAVQADTLEGKMLRLQVAFDEAKESVGARLLPIITNLIDYFIKNVGPAIVSIQEKFKPLTKAIEDNKDKFKEIWEFLKTYVVPLLSDALDIAITATAKGLTILVNVLGKAIDGFQFLYDKYKAFVDFIKNNPLSKFLGNINPFSSSSFTGAAFVSGSLLAGGAVNELGRPVAGGGGGGGGSITDGGVDAATENKRRNTMWKSETIMQETSECPSGKGVYLVEYNYYGEVIKRTLNYCVPLIGQNNLGGAANSGLVTSQTNGLTGAGAGITGSTSGVAGGIVINVNAPSAIDTEGFTRSVIDALNQSQSRTGSLESLAI